MAYRTHNSPKEGFVIGVVLYWLYQRFWWFQVLVIGGFAWLAWSLCYDSLFTERTIRGADADRVARLSAQMVQEPDLGYSNTNLTYGVRFTVKNRTSQVLQSVDIQSELYDCPAAMTPIERCALRRTQALRKGVELQPGDTFSQEMSVAFSGADPVTGYARTSFYISAVTLDRDAVVD